MLPVNVLGIALDGNNIPIVLLKEVDGDRVLPIWIGIAEAAAIADGLEGKDFRRPLTYDLMKRIIEELNSYVDKVVVNELRQNTFHAEIHLIQRNSPHTLVIDARPSDSIALAVRTGTPIYVVDQVMDESGRSDIIKQEEVSQEDKEKFDIKEYLQNMKPEDFGEYDLEE
jgi:hypothetical protein